MISVVVFANEGWCAIDKESGACLATGSSHASLMLFAAQHPDDESENYIAVPEDQLAAFKKFLANEAA